jgi:hypothetical protein
MGPAARDGNDATSGAGGDGGWLFRGGEVNKGNTRCVVWAMRAQKLKRLVAGRHKTRAIAKSRRGCRAKRPWAMQWAADRMRQQAKSDGDGGYEERVELSNCRRKEGTWFGSEVDELAREKIKPLRNLRGWGPPHQPPSPGDFIRQHGSMGHVAWCLVIELPPRVSHTGNYRLLRSHRDCNRTELPCIDDASPPCPAAFYTCALQVLDP